MSYISVNGGLYRVQSVLYMSCRVQFHLKTTLESATSCSHHSAAHISTCREVSKSMSTRGRVWPQITTN